MVTPIIKKIFLLSFILLNIQKIESFWCCKEDTTVNTKFDAQKEADIIQSQQNSAQVSTNILDSQDSQKASPNPELNKSTDATKNDSSTKSENYITENFTEDQDINKKIQSHLNQQITPDNKNLIQNKNNKDWPPEGSVNDEKFIFTVDQIASKKNSLNNSQKQEIIPMIPSANPAQNHDNNIYPILFSASNSTLRQTPSCSLFNVRDNSNDKKNQVIASFCQSRSNDKAKNQKATIDLSPEKNDTQKSKPLGEVHRPINAQDSANPIIFSSGNSSKKHTDTDPMPHHVNNIYKTPELSPRN